MTFQDGLVFESSDGVAVAQDGTCLAQNSIDGEGVKVSKSLSVFINFTTIYLGCGYIELKRYMCSVKMSLKEQTWS